MKIDQHTIFEIPRLNDLNWSERKIARHLCIGPLTVKKYIDYPNPAPAKRKQRASKLDAYRKLIDQFLEQDPQDFGDGTLGTSIGLLVRLF